ncbi:DUF6009 family protein [Streptomyces thermoalcalitolerans]|uniref:DUF6009 family protein n=1 Tax=Streptomyces thermoalcalitolerans TaxID=65605 RepID=UPI0031CDE897
MLGRDTDPTVWYAVGAPAEAVDARTCAPGGRGRRTGRFEGAARRHRRLPNAGQDNDCLGTTISAQDTVLPSRTRARSPLGRTISPRHRPHHDGRTRGRGGTAAGRASCRSCSPAREEAAARRRRAAVL